MQSVGIVGQMSLVMLKDKKIHMQNQEKNMVGNIKREEKNCIGKIQKSIWKEQDSLQLI